jgi:hypothetical protein
VKPITEPVCDSSTNRVGGRKKTPWTEPVSELYRPSNRRLSAKLVPTFANGGCRMVSPTDKHDRILGFLNRSCYFFFQVAPQFTHEAEWTQFQTHYFSENLVVPGIEPSPLDLVAGTLTTRPQRRSRKRRKGHLIK